MSQFKKTVTFHGRDNSYHVRTFFVLRSNVLSLGMKQRSESVIFRVELLPIIYQFTGKLFLPFYQ